MCGKKPNRRHVSGRVAQNDLCGFQAKPLANVGGASVVSSLRPRTVQSAKLLLAHGKPFDPSAILRRSK